MKPAFSYAKDLRRLLTTLLVVPVLLMALVAPNILTPDASLSETAHAQGANPLEFGVVPAPGSGQVAGPPTPRYSRSISWPQVDSAEDAREFFGVSSSDDHLSYRNSINGNWQTPTAGPGSGKTAELNELIGKGNKIRVQVFRSPRPSPEQYRNPVPISHRNLTLVAGNFSETTAGNSAIKTFVSTAKMGGNPSAGLTIAPATAAFDAIFGGNDQRAQWIFAGNGNEGVQQTITCGDKSAKGSRFVYVGDQKPILTAYEIEDLDDEQRIAHVDQTLQGGSFGERRFDDTALAAYLCEQAGSKDGFDQLCEQKLRLPTCVSTKEGIMDALGLNPIKWALDKLREIVLSFVGFVEDGVRAITDIGGLASNRGVTEAWMVMRDLANILFILILGAIAFSTILRIDTKRYGLRSLLPRLVLAVIGVNFSLLLVTVLVNVATVLGNPFLSGITVLLNENPVNNNDTLLGGVAETGAAAVQLIAALVVGVVLLILLLLLVVRVVMIWLLAAFAPLAFLFSVLPFSRSLASRWIRELLKWVFMAPIVYIILWIGARFLSAADTLDAFLLSILVFIGVVIAAIMIPLRLGGEVMQRAISGGKSAAGKGLGGTSAGRSAGAFMAQRKANQEQAAKLRAADWQSRISNRSPRVGRALTGADAGQVAVQSAAVEDKYAKDMGTLGLSPSDQKLIANGEAKTLEQRGLLPAARLAQNPTARRAAAKLLAQNGHWDNDAILDKYKGSGYQTAMKPYDPVMASVDKQGNISDDAPKAIGGYVNYLEPQDSKKMYFGRTLGYADNAGGAYGKNQVTAGQAVFGSINAPSAKALIEHGGRNVIADDGDRQAFIAGMRKYGEPTVRAQMESQLRADKGKWPSDNRGSGQNPPAGPSGPSSYPGLPE